MPLSRDDIAKTVKLPHSGKVTYYEAGAGHPVLLLHGSGPGATGWSNFSENIDQIAQHFRVLAIDMPGWGGSDPVTVEKLDHVAALVEVLDALDLTRAAMVGNSMGGHTALRFATLHPDRISHLVTMGPPTGPAPYLFSPGDGPSEGLKYLIAAYQEPTPENMRRLVEVMTYDKARFATAELTKARSDAALSRPDHLKNYVDGMTSGFPIPRWLDHTKLSQVLTPTLLIHGRDDRVVPYEGTLRLLATIPNSRAVILNRCGHWAMIEHAREFNQLVIDFIKNNPDPGDPRG